VNLSVPLPLGSVHLPVSTFRRSAAQWPYRSIPTADAVGYRSFAAPRLLKGDIKCDEHYQSSLYFCSR